MARRSSSPEISLFPFLSILVCLIGALVLLIVIMTLAQSASATAAMSPEDQARAREAARLRSEVARLETEAAAQAARAAKETASALPEADRARLERLRGQMAQALPAPAADPAAALQALRRQLADLARGRPPVQQEIDRLKAELAARKRKPDDKPPPLVVQPGGSGMGAGVKLTFVEAHGAGLTVHRAREKPLRVPTDAILSDEPFNAFLGGLPKDSRGTVIFLVRSDGLSAYTRGAGWAEHKHGLRTTKLPLPGKGAVDLSKFGITAGD